MDAVREKRFYVYSHPKSLGIVQTRIEDIMLARNPSDPFAAKPEIGAELRVRCARRSEGDAGRCCRPWWSAAGRLADGRRGAGRGRRGCRSLRRHASVGRKFLLAGKGGLNLTHSEPMAAFVARYGAASERVARWLAVLGPQQLREWAKGLGIDTFVGSSGRVFPPT